MFRYARLGLLLVLTALIAAPAQALPAPMSEQKLNDKSDLVAVVRVNTVICTAVTNDEATGEELPAYLAKLKLVEVKKGDAKPGDEVLVTWRAVPKGIVGPWTVNYYPGEVDASRQAQRRRELRFNLVERQERRRQGAGQHRAAVHARRDVESAARAGRAASLVIYER